MSRLPRRLLGGPDPLTYLNNVKASFQHVDLTTFHIFLSEVDAWIKDRNSDPDLDFARLGRISALLQFKPHLLQGFNALLRPDHRLECSTDVKVVRYFVIVTPSGARIISPTQRELPFPASDLELRSLVLLKTWRGLLGAPEEEDWLACIAALLHVILDDPATDAICYGRAYNCMRELAKDSILAPSVLINNLKIKPGPAIHGEAFADIYNGSVAGTSIRFRVLHRFDKKIKASENLYKDLCSEVVAWRQLHHPNILPFIGANTELFSPRFCLLSSSASHGDLMSYLKRHPEHDRFNSICEIVDGISYLHSLDPPIAHKDIKGANVHVNDRFVCCLADFGLSSIVESKRFRQRSPAFQGSVCWRAPEFMDPARFEEQEPQAGDVYSLACTIYEVYTGSPPLFRTHKLSASILHAILLGERPELPPPGTWTADEEEMWWLVGHCWADKPQDRPSINLIKQALYDTRTPKSATILPNASDDDARDFAADLDAVEAWVTDQGIAFGKILSTYFQGISSFDIFKVEGGVRLLNGQTHFGDKVHPISSQRLLSRQQQSVTYQKFLAKIEALHQTAEISPLSSSLPTTPSSSQSSDCSLSPFTPLSAARTDSLPTPPTSPALSHKNHVVSPSDLGRDAPPGSLKDSSLSSSFTHPTTTRMIKPVVDDPSDTGAVRRFLVHKLALHSLVRGRERDSSL